MKNPPRLGLLAVGPVRHAGVARLEAVRLRLGPVKSSSFRVARRMVNTWHAGFAVRDFAELEKAPTLIVDVPEDQLAAVLEELEALTWDWTQRTLLLWSNESDSTRLETLRVRGAAVASFHFVPGFEDRRVAMEGAPKALREVKRLFTKHSIKLTELSPGSKALFRAGLVFTKQFPLPLLHATVQALTSAGFRYVDAVDIGVALAERALRAYVKNGRRAWPDVPGPDTLNAAALDAHSAALAELYRAGLEQGVAVFERAEVESQHPQ